MDAPELKHNKGLPRGKVLLWKASDSEKIDRNEVKDLTERFLAYFQNGLKRFQLMKRARSAFYIDCGRDQFVNLLKGYVDIYEAPRTGSLFAAIKGKNTKAVAADLAAILGLPSDDTSNARWFVRRYYGRNTDKTRDCGYLRIDHRCKERESIRFAYRRKYIKQTLPNGENKEVSINRLHVSFPRHAKSVKPLNARNVSSSSSHAGQKK